MELKQYLELARRETGLTEFGNEFFLAGLQKLLSCVQSDVPFTPAGRQAFDGEIHRALCNRLLIQRDFDAHPEIFEEDISDPVIILGMIRSGTSKLQVMMSADTEIRSFKAWQTIFPGRLSETKQGEVDPRITIAKEMEEVLHREYPEFMAGHEILAEQAEEEGPILQLSFTGTIHWLLNPSNSYYDWSKTVPDDDAYDYLYKVLQYLQWQDGGRQGKRSVLKTPLHIENIPLLMKYFPKATLVHCHRHPRECIRSNCRIQDLGWSVRVAEPRIEDIRRCSLETWPSMVNAFLKSRDELGEKLNIIDVYYEDIRDHPAEVLQKVYRASNIELTPERQSVMLSWDQHNPQYRAGKMNYSEEKYGVTPQMIDASFGAYIDRFFKHR